MTQDFIYTFRLIASRPWQAFLTIVVLVLGMTICLSVYSIVNTVGYKALSLPNADSLVMVDLKRDGVVLNYGGLEAFDVRDLKEQQKIFSSLATFSDDELVALSFDRESMGLQGIRVDSNFFNVVGVEPILGRTINEQDTSLGASNVAVIGYHLWQSSFLGNQNILGTLIRLNNRETEIIGVMPKGYAFPIQAEIWSPLIIDYSDIQRGHNRSFALVGHLKPEVSMDEANSHLDSIADRLEEKYPDSNKGNGIYSADLKSYVLGSEMIILQTMMIAVFFVLLIACVDVGGLLLAQMGERQHEIAIRMALGANRKKIISQMMLESLILTILGVCISLLLVTWILELLRPIFAGLRNQLFWMQFALDSDTFIASIGIVIVTTVVSSLYPAVKASNTKFNTVLNHGTRGAESQSSGKLMKTLVTLQIALSCGLVIVASLMALNNFLNASVDYGISTDSVNYGQFRWSSRLYSDKSDESREYFRQSVRQELEAIPGIESITFASSAPSQYSRRSIYHDKEEIYESPNSYRRDLRVIIDNYFFKTLNVTLKSGRAPNALDDHSEINKVVVTKSFAEQRWPNENPIGKRFYSGIPQFYNERKLEVIGVAPNLISFRNGSPVMNMGTVYIHNYNDRNETGFIVKVDGDPISYQKVIKQVFNRVDQDVTILRIDSLNKLIKTNFTGPNLVAGFFSAFGIAALILALTGIYGIMSISINHKKQEIGVRRALGASDNQVIGWLIKGGSIPLLIGLILGVSIGGGLVFAIIEKFDSAAPLIPYVFTSVVLLIIGVVVLAITIPSRKAIKEELTYALQIE